MTLERRVGIVAAGVGLVMAGVLLLSPIRGSGRRTRPVVGNGTFVLAQTLGMLETAQRAHFRFRGRYASDVEEAWRYVPAWNRPSDRGIHLEITAADSAGWQAIALSRMAGVLCARAGGAGPSAVLDTARLEARARTEGVSFASDCEGSGGMDVLDSGTR